MKGVIFTEFLELVEQEFGLATVDQLIASTELASQGIYTAVGTYDHREIIALLNTLSKLTKQPISTLLDLYGRYLFTSLAKKYQHLLAGISDPFELLIKLDNFIHVEVLKLYPDAELPTFEHEQIDSSTLIMHYRSCRPFAQLAEGLLQGCAEHFDNRIEVSLIECQQDGQLAQFLIKKP